MTITKAGNRADILGHGFPLLRLHSSQKLLRRLPHFIEPFGGDVGTVLPEDGLVETELDELFLVAQLLESGIDEQRREVNLAALARAERTEQRVVAQILYICNRQ